MNETLVIQRRPVKDDFRALVELAPDAVFLARRGGQLTFVNDAACDLAGRARSELLESTLDSLFEAPWRSARTPAVETRLRRADGSWVSVEVRARLLPEGNVQAWVRELPGQPQPCGEPAGGGDGMLRALLDHLPLGVLIFHSSGQLYFNRRSEELLGMKLSPTGGGDQFAHRILLADGRPLPPEQSIPSRVLLAGETLTAVEYLIERPDASRLPILCCAGPILFADGQITAGVAVFQDASERVRMQHTLGANQRVLQTIFDLLPVGVWMADRSGRMIGNNPAAERIWGGARYVDMPHYGEYKGWYVGRDEPIAAEDWALARAITKGETSSGELVRIQCFDGTYKTIINSGAPLRDEAGEISGAIVVNEDITRLHEAQERQRESEQLLHTVFNLLPVGIWIADRDGKITLSNPAAEHIWGGDHYAGPIKGGVEYKAWWAESGEPVAAEEWGLARALRGETSHGELIRIQCFDGSTKTLLNWATPIRSAAGDIVGAIAVNEDVTSLQYTQEQLRSAVRERERILAVVAHDLRNPLAALMAHAATAQAAASRLPGGEKLGAQATSMMDITRRMSGLVHDLLAVGAAGAGGHHMLALSAVTPAGLLDLAADAMRPLAAEKELAIVTKPAGQLPTLRADVNRILRVLGNLLDNAVKFTDPKGCITLAAKSTSAGILFTVANSGAAVQAAELELMFQPFWQAGTQGGGAGLGLAICRSIVEAHGGTIWAEPAEGQRLRVCFVLPRA